MNISYLMFIVQGGMILPSTLIEVEKEIKGKNNDILYLIVCSYGGDPFSTVRIMNVLDKHFKKIYAVVPDIAYSAATLMCLGTDAIYMDDKSILGPLDLPMEHPRDGSEMSSHDITEIMSTLAALANGIAHRRFIFLRDETFNRKLSRQEASKLAIDSTNEFLKPLIEQIDPYHLNKGYREQKIAQNYGADLLRRRMFKGDGEKAWNTATKLVTEYPTHGYCISPQEAKDYLKLEVKELNKLEGWDQLKIEFEDAQKLPNFIKYGEITLKPKKPIAPTDTASQQTIINEPIKNEPILETKE